MSNKIEQLKNLFDYFDKTKDVSIHSTEFKKFGYLIDLNSNLTKPRKIWVDCWMLIKFAKTKSHTAMLPGHRVEDIPNIDTFMLLADVNNQIRFKYISETETNEKYVLLPSSGVKSEKYADSVAKEKHAKKETALSTSNNDSTFVNKSKPVEHEVKRNTESGYLLKFISEVDQSINVNSENASKQQTDEITNEQLVDEFKRFNAKHNLFLEEFSRQEKDIDQIKESFLELVTLFKEWIPNESYLNFVQKSKTLCIEEPDKKIEKPTKKKKDSEDAHEIDIKHKQSQDTSETKENVEVNKLSNEKHDIQSDEKKSKSNNYKSPLNTIQNEQKLKDITKTLKSGKPQINSQVSSSISEKISAKEKNLKNYPIVESLADDWYNPNADAFQMFDIEFDHDNKDEDMHESPLEQNKSLSKELNPEENIQKSFEVELQKDLTSKNAIAPEEISTNKYTNEEKEVRLIDNDNEEETNEINHIHNIAPETLEVSTPLKDSSFIKEDDNLLDSAFESKRKRDKKDESKIESSQSSEERSHKKKHKKHRKHKKKSKHRDKSKNKEDEETTMMKNFLQETSWIPENALKMKEHNDNKKKSATNVEKPQKKEILKQEEEKVYNSDDTDCMIDRHLSRNRIIKPSKKDKFVDWAGGVDYYTSGLYMKREKLSPPRYDRGKDIYEKSDDENSDQGFSRPMQIDREMMELEKKNKEKTKEIIKEKNPDEFDFHSFGSGSDISF